MVCVGAAAFWAANDYSPLGSVFPRAIGGMLVAFGVTYLILFQRWVGPGAPRRPTVRTCAVPAWRS